MRSIGVMFDRIKLERSHFGLGSIGVMLDRIMGLIVVDLDRSVISIGLDRDEFNSISILIRSELLNLLDR
jgi:hypothetical protein